MGDPDPAASSKKSIEELFHAARERPAAEREAWLDGQTAYGADVLREVRVLLAAFAKRDEFRVQQPEARVDASTSGQQTPDRFGPYQTTGILGRGGMGVVYLARRADGQFQQTVAVKVLAAHLAGPEFLKKFQTERQALASLNHPNITRLVDGGISASGTPFLVMEYVDGQALDAYCDGRRLGIEQRLRLFLQVCEAVDYAHRNLIVHRDLKPSNILITADGTVKLLDFGTASLTAEDHDATVTRSPTLTPRYASPEQFRAERANLSNDIFSLGVILYESLTGAWPYGAEDSVVSQLQRAMGLVTPAFPTTRVTVEAAEHRATQPERFRRLLEGDLTAITLKALEHDPSRRYGSVRLLADDIERYLGGRAVHARAQTALYRAGKFLRRRWLPVAAAAVFIMGLCAATLVALYQARVAQARYTDLRSLTTTLLFELKDAISDVPGSTPAQKILVGRVVKSLDRMLQQSAQDPKLRLDLAEAYRQLGELQGDPYGQNLGDAAGALASLAKAQTLANQDLAGSRANPAVLHAAGMIERTIGEVYFGAANAKDAISHLAAATKLFDRLLEVSDAVPDLTEAATADQVLGDVYGQPGTASLSDSSQAATQYRRAIELDQRILRKDPHTWRALRGIGVLHMKLGDLSQFADPETALGEYRQALQTMDALPPDERNRTANARFRAFFLRKTGATLASLKQWSDAEQFLNRALPIHEAALAADPEDNRAKLDLAVITGAYLDLYDLQGNHLLALPPAQRLVSLLDELVRKEPVNTLWRILRGYYRYRLATLLAQFGDRNMAAAAGTQALAELGAIAESPDATNQTLAFASDAFARIEPRALRDPRRALAYAERFRRLSPTGDPRPLYQLAIAQDAAGNRAEAAETARQALALLAPPRNGRVSYTRTELEAIAADVKSRR